MPKSNSSPPRTPTSSTLTFITWNMGIYTLKALFSESSYAGTWHTTTGHGDETNHVFHPPQGPAFCKLVGKTIILNPSPVSTPLTNLLLQAGGKLIKHQAQIKTRLDAENSSPYPLIPTQEHTTTIHYHRHLSVDNFPMIPEWIGKADIWIQQFQKCFNTIPVQTTDETWSASIYQTQGKNRVTVNYFNTEDSQSLDHYN